MKELEKPVEDGEYRRITPPFGYFGSKNKIALKLCEELPPHNCWVEAFCGSAAVTLAKPPAQIEVINDVNGEIVNLFRQLRANHKALMELVRLTPYSEEELIEARLSDCTEDSLEKARLFLVKSMMAINGVFGKSGGGFSYSDSYARNGHEARVNRWNNLPGRLEKVVERLKNVRIEKKDAIALMKRFVNRPATLIYLDPPYFVERTNGYDDEANNLEFHIRLLEMAINSSCMIFISGYQNELYSSMLTVDRGWTMKTIEASTKGTDGTKHIRTEVIWMNRQFANARDSGVMPIELDRKEQTNKKVNPERK